MIWESVNHSPLGTSLDCTHIQGLNFKGWQWYMLNVAYIYSLFILCWVCFLFLHFHSCNGNFWPISCAHHGVLDWPACGWRRLVSTAINDITNLWARDIQMYLKRVWMLNPHLRPIYMHCLATNLVSVHLIKYDLSSHSVVLRTL